MLQCVCVCVCIIALTHDDLKGGDVGVAPLRREKRCWLRSPKRRKDSRLRVARLRSDVVLLKVAAPSAVAPWPGRSMALET